MELILKRVYHPDGTNGRLFIGTAIHPLCRTIELPWKMNAHGISCIPEGKYRIKMRYSERFGEHMYLPDVKDRSLILIHPANNALTELRGCISPVTVHTGEGKGSRSVMAFNKLMTIVKAGMIKGPVFLIIKKSEHDN